MRFITTCRANLFGARWTTEFHRSILGCEAIDLCAVWCPAELELRRTLGNVKVKCGLEQQLKGCWSEKLLDGGDGYRDLTVAIVGNACQGKLIYIYSRVQKVTQACGTIDVSTVQLKGVQNVVIANGAHLVCPETILVRSMGLSTGSWFAKTFRSEALP